MIAACLALTGLSALCARTRALPVLLAPLAALCAMALVALAGGLCGVFSQARFAVVCLGCAAGALSLLPAPPRVKWLRPWRKSDAITLALLCGGLLALALYYDGVRLAYWDEFYWGGFAKALFAENAFWTWDSVLPRRDSILLYPPLITALHGLFMPQGVYTETALAVGGAVPSLVLAFVVWRAARPACSRGNALLLALLCAGLTRVLGVKVAHGYYLVAYVESAQAALFTALSLIALFEPVRRYRSTLLVLGLPVLALCKGTGVLLALCVIGCAVVMEYTSATAQRLRQGIATLLRLGFATGVPWLCWKAWQYVYIVVPGQAYFAQEPAPQSAMLLGKTLLAYAQAFAARSLLDSPWLGSLHYISGAALLCALLCVLAWRLRGRGIPLSQKVGAAVLAMGLPAWLGAHMAASVRYFTAQESLRAAGFERYAGVYMACLCIVGLLFWVRSRPCARYSTRRTGLTLGAALLTLVVVVALPLARPHTLSQSAVRIDMERAAALLTAHTPAGSAFWLVSQGTVGQEPLALRYLLLPERRLADIQRTPGLTLVDAPETRFAAGDLPLSPPNDLRERALAFGADYLLLWRYDDALAQRLAPVLGALGPAPTLLRLTKWHTGAAPLPQRSTATPSQ